MAWGYWTAYTTSYASQNRRQRTLSPPNKRDRSLERERDRISLAATAATPDCVSRTSVTYVSGSGTGSGRDNDAGIMATAVRNHPGIGKTIPSHHLQENHVEPEKVVKQSCQVCFHGDKNAFRVTMLPMTQPELPPESVQMLLQILHCRSTDIYQHH